MEEILIEVYEFSELDDKIQNRIIDAHWEMLVWNESWYRDLLSNTIAFLKQSGIFVKYESISFDFNPDECHVSGKVINLEALRQQFFEFSDKYWVLSNHHIICPLYIEPVYDGFGSGFNHSITRSIAPERISQDLLDELCRDLEKIIEQFCRNLWKRLDTEYNDLTHPATLKNFFSESGFLFYHNGKSVGSEAKLS